MASVLLVHPLFLSKSPEEQAAASPYFPLGLLYLAAYVRDQGHEVAIYDATFEPDSTTFEELLRSRTPDLVGISALMPTEETALELAAIAKDRGCTVLVGGPDATLRPREYLACPAVDIVVHHEGEETIVRLLDLTDSNELEPRNLRCEFGIAYRDGSSVVLNEPRAPIVDLDTLPMPARDLIDMDRYLQVWRDTKGYSSLTISTSRGCPSGCSWCGDAVHGTGFRQRSPGNVAAEVADLADRYNIDRLRMVDDVDAIDRSWLEIWAVEADRADAAVPFEALNDLERQDIPLLDVRDSL